MSIEAKRTNFGQETPWPYVPPSVCTLQANRTRRLEEIIEPWNFPFEWDDACTAQNTFPSIRPGMILRELGEHLTVHDPMINDTHRFNRSAAAILVLCNGGKNVLEISAEYSKLYFLDQGASLADVQRIVVELIEKKVVVPRKRQTYP